MQKCATAAIMIAMVKPTKAYSMHVVPVEKDQKRSKSLSSSMNEVRSDFLHKRDARVQ